MNHCTDHQTHHRCTDHLIHQDQNFEALKAAALTAQERTLWKEGSAILQRHKGRYQKSFLAIVKSLQNFFLDIEKRARTGEAVDIRGAVASINWQRHFAMPLAEQFEIHQTNVFIDSAVLEGRRDLGALDTSDKDAAAETLGPTIIEPSEQVRARSYLSRSSGNRVVDITKDQKRAIQAELNAGIQRGDGIDQIARNIRGKLGLGPRDRRARDNFRTKLKKKRIKKKNGKFRKLTPSEIDRRLAAYERKLVRRRADNVARTEVLQARTNGVMGKWRSDIKRGRLAPIARKKWILSPDPCQICQDIAASTDSLPVNGTWSSPGGEILGPPAHPSCLCSMTLIPIEDFPPDALPPDVLRPAPGGPAPVSPGFRPLAALPLLRPDPPTPPKPGVDEALVDLLAQAAIDSDDI